MCGLFILQNIAMESKHNTKLFYKKCGNINYFNTCELNKNMYVSKRCTLFTVFER